MQTPDLPFLEAIPTVSREALKLRDVAARALGVEFPRAASRKATAKSPHPELELVYGLKRPRGKRVAHGASTPRAKMAGKRKDEASDRPGRATARGRQSQRVAS